MEIAACLGFNLRIVIDRILYFFYKRSGQREIEGRIFPPADFIIVYGQLSPFYLMKHVVGNMSNC